MTKEELFDLLQNDITIFNWKEHADARIPRFDDEKINVYEFNNDKDEPLRPKYWTVTLEDDTIIVNYICQEDFHDTRGMKQEIKRFLKAVDAESISIIFNITSRDGGSRSRLTFNKK